MAKSAYVFNVGDADFEQQVLERSRSKPVLVDFWAPWCQPCLLLGPMLEKVIDEQGGAVLLAKVNVDEAPNLAGSWGIEGIPAVKAFRDGKLVGEFVGLYPEESLREFVASILPTEADRLAKKAGELETTNAAEAEAIYRRILEQGPEHKAALVGLARLLLARGDQDEAEKLLARATPAGDLAPEVERLQAVATLAPLARDLGDEAAARARLAAEPDNSRHKYELGCVLAAAGQYPEALETLLAAAEQDRELARGPVKEAMVKIFQAAGPRSALADDYRKRLTRLLY
jgi:putative thioredoxin